ncbi:MULTISPECIES: acyl-CoA thioesterase [unclassified Photobacterium]|uniref:acyl-CoA thioesterase n=1 Tax=unclassified Photobacterium TaxID=2628852 RepID=UPI001EDEAFFD|nr:MULTISPECIES: acyl-CoA thioesterase [unclassified Photobacterium]MCG3865877.1 acyl-CoA thioesterase [Photobacterium sp. Ph6]MCG3877352.1 acyl-CoA thioesterase [Photobacterium sp. Ph5]
MTLGKPILISAEILLTTNFQDADPMGVIYHGNYFRYFEEARRILMEKLNYSYRQMEASGYMWPIIDTRVKYVKAIPYDHPIRVTATLTEWENRLRVDYVIYDAETGTRMTKGHTMQVAVSIEKREMCFVSPKIFTEKVETYNANNA